MQIQSETDDSQHWSEQQWGDALAKIARYSSIAMDCFTAHIEMLGKITIDEKQHVLLKWKIQALEEMSFMNSSIVKLPEDIRLF